MVKMENSKLVLESVYLDQELALMHERWHCFTSCAFNKGYECKASFTCKRRSVVKETV